MKISIANLSEGIHEFHLSTEAAHVGLGDTFSKEVIVDVRLDKTSKEILLKAVTRGFGTFTCDRCVDEFSRPVVTTFRIVYLYGENEKYRFPADEVQVLDTGTSSIDITDDIRQYLVLAIPVKLLCKEGCKGLCPACGVNRNREQCSCAVEEIDPRWQALKKHFPY